MATAKIRGNSSLRERPDSPVWDFGTQKTTVTRTFEGLYAEVLAAVPARGAAQEGFASLLVENVTIKRAVSGKATMTVRLETQVGPSTDFPAPVQPVYEIEWVQLERPIEQCPFFIGLYPDPSGQTQFSNDQITALNNFTAWENAADANAKQTTYSALTDAFKKLAQKKMRGETTWMLYAPVARITTLARNVTAANECGLIFAEVPNFPDLPNSYQWLSTADRSTRTGASGKWQRVQEWTGAKSWDADLYSNNTVDNGGGRS